MVSEKLVGHKVAERLQPPMEYKRSSPAQKEATARSSIHRMLRLAGSHLLQTIGHDTFMQERSGVMRVIDYHYTALKGDTIGHGRTAHTNANPKALCDVLTAIKAGCGYVYVLYLSRTLTAFALFNFQRFTCIAHLVSDEPRTRTLEIMWTASALHVCVA